MKRFLLPFVFLSVVAPLAFAHVGSPNVFFEGRAGAYSVFAVIRPPAALPGAAQISVRVHEPDIRAVSLQPVLWQAGRQGSPQPVVAQRVPGETNLWSAEVWLLRPGSYTVRIGIEGLGGLGEATVPVNAIGMQSQQMKPGLRATLVAFGLFLFLSAVFIVGAVARESCVKPGIGPTVLHFARGRRAAVIGASLLAASVTAGAVRWRSMDLAYRTQGRSKTRAGDRVGAHRDRACDSRIAPGRAIGLASVMGGAGARPRQADALVSGSRTGVGRVRPPASDPPRRTHFRPRCAGVSRGRLPTLRRCHVRERHESDVDRARDIAGANRSAPCLAASGHKSCGRSDLRCPK